MVNYDIVFMAQGLVDSYYWDQQTQWFKEIKDSLWYPFIVNLFAFVVATTSPTVTSGVGDLWFYPLYFPLWLRNIFIIGAWNFVYFYCFIADADMNKVYNLEVYNYVSSIAMYGYLTHYIFIVIVCVFIIIPFNISYGWAIVLNYTLSMAMICGSYALLQCACGGKKKDKKSSQQVN